MAKISTYINGLTEETTPDGANDFLLLYDASAADAKKIKPDNLPGALATLYHYVNIQDQKAQNTAGGTFTSGAWRTRDLNTEVADTGNFASVASNQITLAAGTYRCHISAPAFKVNVHQTRLQNITDATTIAFGTSEYSNAAGYYSASRSIISTRFTLATSKVLEVQHCSSGTEATDGFGAPCNFGTEVYTIVELWKEP